MEAPETFQSILAEKSAGIEMPELALDASRVPARKSSKMLTSPEKGDDSGESIVNKLVLALTGANVGKDKRQSAEPLIKILSQARKPSMLSLGDAPPSAPETPASSAAPVTPARPLALPPIFGVEATRYPSFSSHHPFRFPQQISPACTGVFFEPKLV